jgi:hypothetical protein
VRCPHEEGRPPVGASPSESQGRPLRLAGRVECVSKFSVGAGVRADLLGLLPTDMRDSDRGPCKFTADTKRKSSHAVPYIGRIRRMHGCSRRCNRGDPNMLSPALSAAEGDGGQVAFDCPRCGAFSHHGSR